MTGQPADRLKRISLQIMLPATDDIEHYLVLKVVQALQSEPSLQLLEVRSKDTLWQRGIGIVEYQPGRKFVKD